MRKPFTSLKRNIATNLILHTAVVLMIGLLCAALSDGFALVFCVLISIVAITVFTIRNIFRCVADDYSMRAKELEAASLNLAAMALALQEQKKELDRCVVLLSQFK